MLNSSGVLKCLDTAHQDRGPPSVHLRAKNFISDPELHTVAYLHAICACSGNCPWYQNFGSVKQELLRKFLNMFIRHLISGYKDITYLAKGLDRIYTCLNTSEIQFQWINRWKDKQSDKQLNKEIWSIKRFNNDIQNLWACFTLNCFSSFISKQP